MPLQYQHVPIALTGIDTKTDDRNVISGKIILGENCWMTKSGKIQSRYGYNAGSQGNVNHIVGGLINGIPAAIRAGSIDKLTSPASSTATNIPVISVQNSVDMTLSPVYPTAIFASAGTAGKVLMGAFNGSNFNQVSLLDTVNMIETSAVTTNVGTIYNARVTADGNSAAITVGLGNNMKLLVSPTMTTINQYTVTPIAGVASNIHDISFNSSGNVGITWVNAGNVYFAYHNGTSWSGTTTVAAFAATAVGIAKGAVSGKWTIVAALGTTIKVYVISSTGTLDSTTTYTGSGYTDADAIVVMPSSVDRFAVQGRNVVAATNRSFGVFVNNGAVSFFEPSVKIGAKCADNFLTLVNGSIKNFGDATAEVQDSLGISSYSVFYLGTSAADYRIEYAFSYASGRARLIDLGSGAQFGALVLSQPSFQVGGLFFAQRITDYIKSIGATSYTIVNTSYRIASDLPMWQEYNGSAYTNAFGAIRQISSTAITPQEVPTSFPFPPSIAKLTAIAGTMTPGTYQVVLIYETFDARGRAVWSSTSIPESITLSAPNAAITVTVNSPYYSIVSEYKHQIVAYVTEANGTIFYRAGITAFPGTTVSITRNPDKSEQVLYTTGGVLDSGNPGISAGIFTARDRLWSISSENRNVVYFSQINSPNEVPKFNESLYLNVPDLGGKIVAIAEMDEKILIFKESALYFTYGAGPDNLGIGEYPAPQLFSQSLGCIYPRSVVLTDNGVIFMSKEGIWLVDRGLALKYIGAPVEAYNSLVITGAMNLVDRHQVWFFSSDGTSLSYDEFHQLWYAFTNQPTKVPILQENGTPSFVNSSTGTYLIESSSAVNDNGVAFKLKLKSGWTSLTGIQGFQRFRRMQWSGSATNTMTLKLSYDFSTSVFETFTVTTAAVGTTPYQWEVKPARQKCEAIQFELESESLTAALSLSTFSIEAGAKQGTNRLPIAKRVQGV